MVCVKGPSRARKLFTERKEMLNAPKHKSYNLMSDKGEEK